MASILGYTVTSWPVGNLRYPVQRIGLVQPAPGFDGLAVATSGWVSDPQRVVTLTQAADPILGDRLIQAYHALHRQVGTIVDQWPRTFTDATIISVVADMYRTGLGYVLVQAEWMILLPTVRPT
jgi:hypothetical protein